MMLKLMDCVRNRIECKRERPMQTKFTTFSSVEWEIGGNTYLDKMIVKVMGLDVPLFLTYYRDSNDLGICHFLIII